MTALNESALKQLFTEARTHNAWQDKEVSDETLQRLYDLMKWGPTSANSTPARLIFVKSQQGKERLKPWSLTYLAIFQTVNVFASYRVALTQILSLRCQERA